MARRARWQGPSLEVISEEAGVSVSTVDRVLNERPNVSQRARDAVLGACQRLGLELTGNTSSPPVGDRLHPLRIAVLSESGENLNDRIEDLCRAEKARPGGLDIREHLVLTHEFVPDSFVETLDALPDDTDGVILNCRDDSALRRAVDRVVDRGIPVVCVTTDLPNSKRLAYVGMDQFAAGASAAHLMARFLCGRAGSVILVASAPFICQEQRESGFRRTIRSEAEHLVVRDAINTRDHVESAYETMKDVLRKEPGPVAVYNTAGGNIGIARALEEAGLAGKVVFIGHEGSSSSMRLLESRRIDAVIAHPLDREFYRAVEIVEAARRNLPLPDSRIDNGRPVILLRPMVGN